MTQEEINNNRMSEFKNRLEELAHSRRPDQVAGSYLSNDSRLPLGCSGNCPLVMMPSSRLSELLRDQPEQFTLGTGHVKFFYDKLLYLRNRYVALRSEALRRGFKVSDFSGAWADIPPHLMNDYTPTKRDRSIILKRIKERL